MGSAEVQHNLHASPVGELVNHSDMNPYSITGKERKFEWRERAECDEFTLDLSLGYQWKFQVDLSLDSQI